LKKGLLKQAALNPVIFFWLKEYAWTFCFAHHLSLKDHRFPPASLSEHSLPLRTDNVKMRFI